MGGECVHLGRFHSDEVMVVFFIAECASKTHSKIKSTLDRNCYDWLKNHTVAEVVGTVFRRLCLPKGLFWRAQPPKWRAQPWTQPQIAVFVSEVVIAKVTLNTVLLGFSEKRFCLCPFLRGCVHAKMKPNAVRTWTFVTATVDYLNIQEVNVTQSKRLTLPVE